MQASKRNVLVAVANYPDNHGKVAAMFVHTRNKYYKEHGINVTVLNFYANNNYVFDGIAVITLDSFEQEQKKYDVLICHAPRLLCHYSFLKKHGKDFPKFVFFFHGGEILKTNVAYPRPYSYARQSRKKELALNLFDVLKLFVWGHYLLRVIPKSEFVFVSQWMLNEFLKGTKTTIEMFKDSYAIIYNSVGRLFEEAEYEWETPKEYDFITVRNNLDDSKYCADIVNELAKNNPKMKFLVIGKGHFFDHYKKAPNLEWKNQTMQHAEIIQHLQKSRCALMPTRCDAQGLMMCEMASIGMPVISSDILVCKEVFDGFDNVSLIDNEDTQIDLNDVLCKLEKRAPFQKNNKYYSVNTSSREIDLITQSKMLS